MKTQYSSMWMGGHSLIPLELFKGWKGLKRFKGYYKIAKKEHRTSQLNGQCAQIFSYCIYLAVLDIAKNNTTFVIPSCKGKVSTLSISKLHYNRYETNAKDLPLKIYNDEEGNRYTLRYQYSDRGKYERARLLRVNKKMAEYIAANWTLRESKLKYIDDYIPEVQKAFSAFSCDQIKFIVNRGFMIMTRMVNIGCDFYSQIGRFYLYIGDIPNDEREALMYFLDQKLRLSRLLREMRGHNSWNGKYYMAINEDDCNKYIKNNNTDIIEFPVKYRMSKFIEDAAISPRSMKYILEIENFPSKKNILRTKTLNRKDVKLVGEKNSNFKSVKKVIYYE